MRVLTESELREDLKSYYERLQIAKNKLANLPVGYLPFKEHKKREKMRRALSSEIEHVKNLIAIGEEAMVDV